MIVEDQAGDTRLFAWSPDEIDEPRVLHNPRADVSGVAVSADGERIAWVEGDVQRGAVSYAALATFAPMELARAATDPGWSPDGSSLVYASSINDGVAVLGLYVGLEGARPGTSYPLRLTTPATVTDADP